MYKILKKYYILMAIFFIPNILIIFCCTFETKFEILTPATASKVDNRFVVTDGYESSNLYSLSVYSIKYSTLFQNVIADLSYLYDRYEISTSYYHLSDVDWTNATIIQRNQSREMSVITAYEAAGKIDSSIYVDYNYTGVIVMMTSSLHELFEIGDIITHIDDVKLTSENQINPNHEDYININKNSVFTVIKDNKTTSIDFNIEIPDVALSNGDVLSYNNYLYYTTSTYDKFEILKSSPSYSISNYSSTGPSAGMMQTLSIYNQLTEKDITLINGEEVKIAGTGTIETDGSIGAIGGMKQKVYAALKEGAKYLLVSDKNYDEAVIALSKMRNNKTMTIVKCTTFEDVLKWIQ